MKPAQTRKKWLVKIVKTVVVESFLEHLCKVERAVNRSTTSCGVTLFLGHITLFCIIVWEKWKRLYLEHITVFCIIVFSGLLHWMQIYLCFWILLDLLDWTSFSYIWTHQNFYFFWLENWFNLQQRLFNTAVRMRPRKWDEL